MKWHELEYLLVSHCRKGGKVSRRRQADRVRQFLSFSRQRGVRGPDQIGTRHAYEWYAEAGLADTTLRDRYYAVGLVWQFLGRGKPPCINSLCKTPK